MSSGTSALSLVSLFTGAGGLDLGLEKAGFDTRLCVEFDDDARATIQRNRPSWQLSIPGNIYELEARELMKQARLEESELVLLAGGPPCQPFSKSGYWSHGDAKRLEDPRAATLEAFLGIVEAALPQVILLENVRGLVFDGKDEGLRLLKCGLRRINNERGTSYNLVVLHLNAAHFGVPQLRERVFLIASRTGLAFEAPHATHGESFQLEPYRTAWDAIGDLDVDDWPQDLALTGKWAGLLPSIPEGQNYLWHTPRGGGEPLFGWRTRFWSFLLKLAKCRPSWTIQAERALRRVRFIGEAVCCPYENSAAFRRSRMTLSSRVTGARSSDRWETQFLAPLPNSWDSRFSDNFLECLTSGPIWSLRRLAAVLTPRRSVEDACRKSTSHFVVNTFLIPARGWDQAQLAETRRLICRVTLSGQIVPHTRYMVVGLSTSQ